MREVFKAIQRESFSLVPKMKNCLTNYLFPLVNEQISTFKEVALGTKTGRHSVVRIILWLINY